MSLCFNSLTTQTGLISSLFMVGLVGGFTHCAGMCGPFVLAQTSSRMDLSPAPGLLEKIKSTALLPYHLGRLTTYVMLAVVLQSFLGLGFIYDPVKTVLSAGLLFLAALIFLANMVPALTKLLPWLVKIHLPVPSRILMKAAQPALNSTKPGKIQLYVLGILLGFMPCGMVMGALVVSATAATTGQAALSMLAFGAGTLPALWLVAMGGRVILLRWPHLVPIISGVLMSASIVVLVLSAGTIIF